MTTSAAADTSQDEHHAIHVSRLHDASGENTDTEDIRSSALDILRPHLPVSLPLYRRLQFGRFFASTVLLSNLPLNEPRSTQPDPTQPWLLAFTDRSCRPETEVWLFASWESLPYTPALSPTGPEQALILALLRTLKALPIPPSIHSDILALETHQPSSNTTSNNEPEPAKDSANLTKADYTRHMLDPTIMLWGSIHERTLPLLQRLGVAGGEADPKAAAVPNLMFTWDVDALPPPPASSSSSSSSSIPDLPPNLHWGTLHPTHFPLVRSRTQIPRQDRTLAVLPNLAIFLDDGSTPTEEPIAWVFVGLDGSLTTLHVEPAWRGRGLAKAMTAKLFREEMGMFWEEKEGLTTRWAHGYVIRGNRESEGMCRSLGGRSGWDVYWVRVELGAVE